MAAPLEPFIVALLLGITLAAFLVAILQKEYVRAVIAFAAGSAFVAALFAYLGAPFGAVLVGVLALFPALPPAGAPGPGTGWIGQGLWEVRGLDLAAQAFIVLAGVFGVLLVLGRPGE